MITLMWILMWILLALAAASPWWIRPSIVYFEEMDRWKSPPWYVSVLAFVFGQIFLFIPFIAGWAWGAYWAPRYQRPDAGLTGIMIMTAWSVIVVHYAYQLGRVHEQRNKDSFWGL
jgi:Kef-type K+ transport system membrane component KefB